MTDLVFQHSLKNSWFREIELKIFDEISIDSLFGYENFAKRRFCKKILQLEPLQILDLHRKACETKILQAFQVSGPLSGGIPSSWDTTQDIVYKKRTSMKM